jgi:hypothetical protein
VYNGRVVSLGHLLAPVLVQSRNQRCSSAEREPLKIEESGFHYFLSFVVEAEAQDLYSVLKAHVNQYR